MRFNSEYLLFTVRCFFILCKNVREMEQLVLNTVLQDYKVQGFPVAAPLILIVSVHKQDMCSHVPQVSNIRSAGK